MMLTCIEKVPLCVCGQIMLQPHHQRGVTLNRFCRFRDQRGHICSPLPPLPCGVLWQLLWLYLGEVVDCDQECSPNQRTPNNIYFYGDVLDNQEDLFLTAFERVRMNLDFLVSKNLRTPGQLGLYRGNLCALSLLGIIIATGDFH